MKMHHFLSHLFSSLSLAAGHLDIIMMVLSTTQFIEKSNLYVGPSVYLWPKRTNTLHHHPRVDHSNVGSFCFGLLIINNLLKPLICWQAPPCSPSPPFQPSSWQLVNLIIILIIISTFIIKTIDDLDQHELCSRQRPVCTLVLPGQPSSKRSWSTPGIF